MNQPFKNIVNNTHQSVVSTMMVYKSLAERLSTFTNNLISNTGYYNPVSHNLSKLEIDSTFTKNLKSEFTLSLSNFLHIHNSATRIISSYFNHEKIDQRLVEEMSTAFYIKSDAKNAENQNNFTHSPILRLIPIMILHNQVIGSGFQTPSLATEKLQQFNQWHLVSDKFINNLLDTITKEHRFGPSGGFRSLAVDKNKIKSTFSEICVDMAHLLLSVVPKNEENTLEANKILKTAWDLDSEAMKNKILQTDDIMFISTARSTLQSFEPINQDFKSFARVKNESDAQRTLVNLKHQTRNNL